MRKHWTEKDLKEELSKIQVIVDTREQVNEHITSYLDAKKIPFISRKLDVGDYSAQIGDMTFEDDFAIERKHNLDELAANMSGDRDRFEREFLRAKAKGIKVYLIIEEATLKDVITGNYRSKLNPKSMFATLLSWQTRFNVNLIFTGKSDTGQIIYGLIYYNIREVLLNGRTN